MAGAAPKRALGIFVAAFIVTTAELCWWVTFNLQETAKLARQEAQLVQRDQALAQWLAQTLPPSVAPGAAEPEPEPWLTAHFPNLTRDPQSGAIVPRPQVLSARASAHGAHVRMFIAEGAFFFFMVLLGAGLIMRTIRREVGVVRQQANFLNAVTHELKSPLAAMRLYIETLERRRVDAPTLARYVATLRSECDRLEVLVGHVLTLARLEARPRQERQILQPQAGALNLAEVVGQVVQQAAHTRRHGGCPIRYEPPPQGVFVAMEEAGLRTVVRNLLDNAIKYGSTGDAIEVRVLAQEGRAVLSVRDFGIGIEPDEIGPIFERFYRVGDEMVRRHEGSGLGLYLVRMLLGDYGGRITVNSAGLGHGATFVVSLPLAPRELT